MTSHTLTARTLSSTGPSTTTRTTTPTVRASHLRLTRRGRLVLTTLVALPLVAAAGAFALNGGVAVASNSSSSTSFEYVQVSSGQSLWQLAQSIAPAADPRDVVSDLLHLNQLGSADVHPGQQLALPAKYSN
ncbi:LysM peptidoglycan-binding domain-containing protein [Marisediminicola antarctica]|uniref:LysM peptidoglycan-binding domain-containing protein n=1 Tax=Marisediminicola antarctica TaxID=674079 RepID=UPI001379BB2F|nr:LysM peptidoglycan-binding domain-containing protein [Marisediminicola antarctica]